MIRRRIERQPLLLRGWAPTAFLIVLVVLFLTSSSHVLCKGVAEDAWAGLFTRYAQAHHLSTVVATLPDDGATTPGPATASDASLPSVAEQVCAWYSERNGVLVWYTPPGYSFSSTALAKGRFVRAAWNFLDALPSDLTAAVGRGDALLLEGLPSRLRSLALYAAAPTTPAQTVEKILGRRLLPEERVAVRPALRMFACFYDQAAPLNGGLLGTPVVLNVYPGASLFFPCPFEFVSQIGETLLHCQHSDFLTFALRDAPGPDALVPAALAACPLWGNGVDRPLEKRLANARFAPGPTKTWTLQELAAAMGESAQCEIYTDRQLAPRRVFVFVAAPSVDVLHLICWLCNATGGELRVVDNVLFLAPRKAPLVPRFGMGLPDARREQALVNAFLSEVSTRWPRPVRALMPLARTTSLYDGALLPGKIRHYFSRVQELHRKRDPTGHYPPLPETYWVRLSLMTEVEVVALAPHKQPEAQHLLLWRPRADCGHYRRYVRNWAMP